MMPNDIETQTMSASNITGTTEDDLNESYVPYNYKPFDEASAVISYILCVAVTIPNCYVIYVLHRRVRTRTRLHFFILHLAYADVLVGAFVVLGDAIHSTLYGEWYGGDAFCRIYRFLRVLILCASNNLLIGMSVDRFVAVKWPMKFVKVGSKLDKALVIGAWLISIIFSIFYLPFTKGSRIDGCYNTFPSEMRRPFFTINAVLVYIVPTIVIITCYGGICVIIWKKWRESYKLSELNDKHNKRDSPSGLLPKARIKSIKMTLVICLAFFVCWTPFFVISLISLYDHNAIDPGWNMLIGMLYPLNSAANPFIFMVFNGDIFCKGNGRSLQSATDDTDTQPTSV